MKMILTNETGTFSVQPLVRDCLLTGKICELLIAFVPASKILPVL